MITINALQRAKIALFEKSCLCHPQHLPVSLPFPDPLLSDIVLVGGGYAASDSYS